MRHVASALETTKVAAFGYTSGSQSRRHSPLTASRRTRVYDRAMTPDELTPESIEQAAKALLDNRLESVRQLGATQAARRDADRRAADAARADTEAYDAALKDGWSDAELSELGFTKPDKTRGAKGTRGRSRAPRPAASPTPAAAASE